MYRVEDSFHNKVNIFLSNLLSSDATTTLNTLQNRTSLIFRDGQKIIFIPRRNQNYEYYRLCIFIYSISGSIVEHKSIYNVSSEDLYSEIKSFCDGFLTERQLIDLFKRDSYTSKINKIGTEFTPLDNTSTNPSLFATWAYTTLGGV